MIDVVASLPFVLNALACGAIAVQCVCRAKHMSLQETKFAWRAVYSLTGAMAASSIIPWPWPWVSWATHSGLLLGVAGILFLNAKTWPQGQPEAAKKHPTGDTIPLHHQEVLRND